MNARTRGVILGGVSLGGLLDGDVLRRPHFHTPPRPVFQKEEPRMTRTTRMGTIALLCLLYGIRCAAGQQPYLPPVPPGMGCVAAQLGWWSTYTVTNYTPPGSPPSLSGPGQPASFTVVETITLPVGVPIQYRDPLPLFCWLAAHGGPMSLVNWTMTGSVWRNARYTATVVYGNVFTITVN